MTLRIFGHTNGDVRSFVFIPDNPPRKKRVANLKAIMRCALTRANEHPKPITLAPVTLPEADTLDQRRGVGR